MPRRLCARDSRMYGRTIRLLMVRGECDDEVAVALGGGTLRRLGGRWWRSSVERKIERFLAQNPKLQQAMEIVEISTEQYALALRALSTPVVYTATGSNEGAGVLDGQLEPDPG